MRYDDLSNSELARLIDEYVRGRDAPIRREILKDRLIDGLLYEELAEKHHFSVRSIQRIVYRASEQLFKQIDI